MKTLLVHSNSWSKVCGGSLHLVERKISQTSERKALFGDVLLDATLFRRNPTEKQIVLFWATLTVATIVPLVEFVSAQRLRLPVDVVVSDVAVGFAGRLPPDQELVVFERLHFYIPRVSGSCRQQKRTSSTDTKTWQTKTEFVLNNEVDQKWKRKGVLYTPSDLVLKYTTELSAPLLAVARVYVCTYMAYCVHGVSGKMSSETNFSPSLTCVNGLTSVVLHLKKQTKPSQAIGSLN